MTRFLGGNANPFDKVVDANGNPVMVTYSDGTTAQAMTYESDVKTMIAMLQPVMEQYIVTSRRFAVRMALQGGLKDYARGLSYDAVTNDNQPREWDTAPTCLAEQEMAA